MANLSHLDGQSLQRFIDTDLHDFVRATESIRQDDTAGRALSSLLAGESTPETLQQNQFLALGPMTDNDLTHGKALVAATTKSAKSIDEILLNQQRLFRDIDRDFRQVIKTMGDKQSDNIAEIEAEKLLDIFEDVDNDMGGSDTKTQSEA